MARKVPSIALPADWPRHIKLAILHVISLAQVTLAAARARASRSRSPRVRLGAELEEAKREIFLLQEELRVKDLRMRRVKPRRRPHYRAIERMAILELRAARGWNTATTADRFLLQRPTVAEWMKRVDEGGERALVETQEPVNRFPDFVRHIVRRLKVLCPTMGKKRIAQTLSRVGLGLGVTTVGRILKEKDGNKPKPEDSVLEAEEVEEESEVKPVYAKGPNHIWQIDLTVVPTAGGFWTAWLPFSIPQIWPFAWWVACVVDHYSRRVMGFRVFAKEPKSIDMRTFLGRVAAQVGATPKYIVSDKGGQFDCAAFKAWCKRRGIEPRYASTGSLRATAVIERFLLSLKSEWLRRIQIPLRRDAMRCDISSYIKWFSKHRPHQGLDGQTPEEVYDGLQASDVKRARRPTAQEIPRSELFVRFHEGRRELPIVELRRAA